MKKNIIITFILIFTFSTANVFSSENNIGIGFKFGYAKYKLDAISSFNYDCVYNSIAPISSTQFSSINSDYSDYGIILSGFLKYKFTKYNFILLMEFDYINVNSEAETYDINNRSNSRKSKIDLEAYPITFLLLYNLHLSKIEMNVGGGVSYYYSKFTTDWFAPSTSSYLIPPKDWYGANFGYKIQVSLEYPILEKINIGFDINYRGIKINSFKDSNEEELKIYSVKEDKTNRVKVDLSGFHSSLGIIFYF